VAQVDTRRRRSRYSVSEIEAPPLRESAAYRAQDVPRDCSTMELLAAVVGGPRQTEIAGELVGRFRGLDGIVGASGAELTAVRGLGEIGVGRLKAAFELGRRRMVPGSEKGWTVRSPADVAAILMPDIGLLEQRETHVLYLNERSRLVGRDRVYKGTSEGDWARTSELLRGTVIRGCKAIVVARNEPETPLEARSGDVLLARRVTEAAELLEVDVLDYVIVGRHGFLSLKERGLGFDCGRSGAKRRKKRKQEQAEREE
jgi:DNA repair protein RadC